MTAPRRPQLPGHFHSRHSSSCPVQPQLKRPVAPPVYRPQPVPRVLQTKTVSSQQPQQARRPVPPPVYRPQPVPKVLQTKAALDATQFQSATHGRPSARTATRPEPKQTVTMRQQHSCLPLGGLMPQPARQTAGVLQRAQTNNSHISEGRVNVTTQGVTLSLTSKETKKQLVSSGSFAQEQVVDLHTSTTRDPPQHFQWTNPNLYSNPALKSFGKTQTGPLLDSHSHDMTPTVQQQERTKYALRVNELKDLSTRYQEIIMHCNNGRTRTPLVAALYIALTENREFLAVLKDQIVKAYIAERPNLSQMLGVNIKELNSESDEWIEQNAKMVDLAKQVYQDLKQAKVGLQEMENTAAEDSTGEFEPIARRTRSQLDLTGIPLRSLLGKY